MSQSQLGAPSSRRSMTPWLMIVLAVILFSGILFGYDQGVIAGALHGIQKVFSLSPLLIEVVTSWVTLGALFGSLAAGVLADRFGRKHAILLAASMFVAGSLVEAFASGILLLAAGRLIVGAGVGMVTVATPLYASELAPAALRGRFFASYQFAIAFGIFIAYFINGWLAKSDAWRWMLGASAVPGCLLLAAAFFAPQSPRWLMKMRRRPEALVEICKVHPHTAPEPELDAIEQALRGDQGVASWSEIFHPQWRRPLMIGLGLAVLQQITGINAIIYYADRIFGEAGFTTEASRTTVTTWAVGATNVLATLVALALIDRLGRRKLLLAGLLGMTISMAVIGLAFRYMPVVSAAGSLRGRPETEGLIALAAVMTFIFSFGFSVGPVVWTVINEIFPGHIRGTGVAVATAANWAAAFLISQSFLTVNDVIGAAFTFWMFALFGGAGWFWAYQTVPETRGKSLEQLQQMWQPESTR